MAGHLLSVILMFHEIQAQALLPPTLTVSTAVISETDSVTLHCQAPTSVSAHQCFFYTGKKNTYKAFSCLQNFTATELLLMSDVKVRCFYTGELNSTSAHSEPSSITIQSQTPQMSVQRVNGEHVQFVCSLPGSVKDDTRCNLYFGEASRSALTATVWKKSSTETKQRFCQFYVSIDDFLRHLHFVQQKEASCDYTLKREPRSLSPRSDRYNLTAILESESPKINKPSSIMTTESSLNKPSTSTSTTSVNSLSGLGALNLSATTGVNTPVKTTQYITSGDSTTDSNKTNTTVKVEESLWNLAAAVTRYGIVVGFILLVLGLHIFKRRTVEENLNLQQMKNENSDIYHVYATISEETDAPDSQDTI